MMVQFMIHDLDFLQPGDLIETPWLAGSKFALRIAHKIGFLLDLGDDALQLGMILGEVAQRPV